MSDNTYATLSFANLSFTNGSDLWTPISTGDWSRDCATGRAAAAELMRVMDAREWPFLFGHIVKSIVERGSWGGVEVGFCQGIAESVTGGAGV